MGAQAFCSAPGQSSWARGRDGAPVERAHVEPGRALIGLSAKRRADGAAPQNSSIGATVAMTDCGETPRCSGDDLWAVQSMLSMAAMTAAATSCGAIVASTACFASGGQRAKKSVCAASSFSR